jgi:ElaB/YqjD/DUF883 family membrane-anchored ribosome-binding protein
MPETDVSELASKASALIFRFERRCDATAQQLQSLAHDLSKVTQQLPSVLQHSANGSLQTLPAQLLSKIQEGLDRPVDDYQQRLDAAGEAISDGAQALSQQLQRMERLHCLLIWKVVGVTTSSLALLFAGGLWLSMHYASVIRDNQLSADLLKRYNTADVQICGGQLCANVDVKGKRYGSKGEYVPVRDRSSPK